MSLFLTKDEIVELTSRRQKQKQIDQLLHMRIPFERDAFGWPKVLRVAIEQHFGSCNTELVSSINISRLQSFKG